MVEPRFDVTTVGETMLRLSVPAGIRLQTAQTLEVNVGGAESNVVAALARLGRHTAWVSALPATPLGRRVVEPIRATGVETSRVIWRKSGRVGTYFVEFGDPPRGVEVFYDRAGACVAELQPEELPWELLLDTRLVHLTGILPALSPSCRAVTEELVWRAREAGVPVSFDVNFRARLWTAEQARETLTALIAGVDLLFCARRDAITVFGMAEADTSEQIARSLAARSNARAVIVSDGSHGTYVWENERLLTQPALSTVIVDRLGAGDALAAGTIHGWLDGSLQTGLSYGAWLAALILAQHGDMIVTSTSEIERLLQQAELPLRR